MNYKGGNNATADNRKRKNRQQDIIYLRQNERVEESFSPTCSHFGCGRLLSLTEQLHGTKCIHHQQININHETLHRTNA